MTETDFFDLLKRVEAAQSFIEKKGDIEELLKKFHSIESLLSKFGTLDELVSHLDWIKSKVYLCKEFLTPDEAANYLGVTKRTIYKISSTKEINVYKPSAKCIYFNIEDLNDWIRKVKVMSQEELERSIRIELLKEQGKL